MAVQSAEQALRFLLLALCALVAGASAQHPGGRRADLEPATVSGTVCDSDLGVPVEYANIVLYRLRDSSQATGTVTRADGRFELTGLRPGRFYLEVSFIGYRTRTVDDIQIAPGARLDLGRIPLKQTIVAVEGVEATAERPQLSYRIDKKVIDVGRMATAASGTAVDVLENVPSVKVDVEGNVSLRGSGNFTVLIDGKPSPIEGSDALQQIPAPTIDKIEIITNPSAKFDPEGVSGIINVLLKKQRQAGISGIATADGGWPERYGGSFLLSYRLDGLSLFGGADLRQGKFPGSRLTESWTRDTTGDTTFSNSTGEGEREHGSHGLRAGGDYRFSESDRTSLSLRYGDHGFGMNQEATYTRWTAPVGDTTTEVSRDSSHRGGTHLSVNLEHQHQFSREGHELLASASYMRRGGADRSTNRLSTSDGTLKSGLRQEETGPRQPLRFKLDYSLPLREEDKLEVGTSASIHRARSENAVWAVRADSAGDSLLFRQAVDYSDNIFAFYAQYPGKLGRFGFQPGLRLEHADRLVAGDSGDLPFERWDYFPTLHLSYDLPANQQVMASFTRRIERPRGWELWPFLSWQDAYNVRRGNPNLKPELTDAFEVGWQMPLGESRVSAEGYYRITHDLIEHFRSVYAPGVILHTAENVGTDYSLGAELLFDLQLAKWWNVDLSGDLYDYRVTGELGGQDFSKSSFNWGGRLSSEFRLPTQTRLQFNVHYESPEVEAQGRDAARLMTDAAIRQQFFNRQLSVTLQVRDLLSTGKFESTAEGEDFYNHFRLNRQAPMVSLNVTWNFNNYRPERRRPESDTEDLEPEGETE